MGESEGDYIGMGWPERRDVVRWCQQLIAEDPEAEIVLYGDIVSQQPVDFWTGQAIEGNYITPEGFLDDLSKCKGKNNLTIRLNSCGV